MVARLDINKRSSLGLIVILIQLQFFTQLSDLPGCRKKPIDSSSLSFPTWCAISLVSSEYLLNTRHSRLHQAPRHPAQAAAGEEWGSPRAATGVNRTAATEPGQPTTSWPRGWRCISLEDARAAAAARRVRLDRLQAGGRSWSETPPGSIRAKWMFHSRRTSFETDSVNPSIRELAGVVECISGRLPARPWMSRS